MEWITLEEEEALQRSEGGTKALKRKHEELRLQLEIQNMEKELARRAGEGEELKRKRAVEAAEQEAAAFAEEARRKEEVNS